MVHDYNSGLYSGTKRAVDEYAKENSIFPIPVADSAGSVIIIKQ